MMMRTSASRPSSSHSAMHSGLDLGCTTIRISMGHSCNWLRICRTDSRKSSVSEYTVITTEIFMVTPSELVCLRRHTIRHGFRTADRAAGRDPDPHQLGRLVDKAPCSIVPSPPLQLLHRFFQKVTQRQICL